MTRWAVFVLAAVTGIVAEGCGAHRILGFGSARDGILLVRHTETAPQRISIGDRTLGVAPSGETTCFTDVPTGSLRVEAHPVAGVSGTAVGAGSAELTRATTLVLPPDQPLLWDVDHDQVVSGRAHRALCDSGG